MATGEFETLAKKVEQAVAKIEELKHSRDGLQSELHAALERAGNLEKELAGRREEIAALNLELERKTENMSLAGERIRGLVSLLETALA
jgi:chromosome segregation ATPase